MYLWENGCFKNATGKDVLAQIDATRSLADSTTSDVEDSIEDIWMTIVEANPKIKQYSIYKAQYIKMLLIHNYLNDFHDNRKQKIIANPT